MQDKIHANILLDYYGGLLTERQQEICRYYYREDLSYQEIADLEKISRTAVYDTIRHCNAELTRYEEILQCIHACRKRQKYYQEIKETSSDPKIQDLVGRCERTEIIGGNYE